MPGVEECGTLNNATPKAASYVGSLELLRELPYILGLGAYLVKNDHSRRKLDSKDHYKYATGGNQRSWMALKVTISGDGT